jgi:hypothetical protein
MEPLPSKSVGVSGNQIRAEQQPFSISVYGLGSTNCDTFHCRG